MVIHMVITITITITSSTYICMYVLLHNVVIMTL
jgi:hypothetical protein